MKVLFCDPLATATLVDCLSIFLALSVLWRLVIGLWFLSQIPEEQIFEMVFEFISSDSFQYYVVSVVLELFLWFLLANPHFGPGGSRVFQLSIPLFLGGLEEV